MANYTGYKVTHLSLGVSDTALYVPAEGWDRDWGNRWGSVVNPFRGWNTEWGLNWSSVGKGTREAEGFIADVNVRVSDSVVTHGHLQFPNNNFSGVLCPSYSDIFYNRILIEPTRVNFGSIVSDQSIDIDIFNAYFVNSTLSDLVETNFDAGISLVAESTPATYFPLEEKTYTITAILDGPAQTDATLTFDWLAPIPDISIPITGSRIVLLPVTYRDKVKETLLFKTDILNSYNGTEQRVMVRQNPRHQFAIKAYLNKSDRFRVENLIYGWRSKIWAIPMWPEARMGDPITNGDLTIYVDTTYADFRINQLAVIYEHSRKFDVFQIASKTDTSIVLNRGVNDDYDNPIIMPVRSARMVKDPIRKTTGHDAILEAILEVTDNLAYPASASAIQFNGEDTFFMDPLQTTTDGAPDKYEHRVDLMDNTTGVITQFAPWDHIRINREFELILEGTQEIWEIREWLYRRAGKLRPFYMPTYENNMRLLSQGTITDSFVVEEDAFSLQATARNHIAIKQTDGSYLFRTVVDSEINVDGNTDITIDSALNIQADEIEEINFFGLKRLSSDEIDLIWLPNNVVSITIPITEVEP
jgi:hypothetical protein